MPTPKLPWSKSNRSHSSVGGSSNEHSPVPSVNNETAQPRYPSPGGPQQYQQPQHSQGPPGQQIPQGDPQGPYRQPPPSRTASYRHSSNLSLERPPGNAPTGPPQPSPHAQNPPPVDSPRRASVQPVLSPPPQHQPQETKKPSLRSRLVAGLAGHKDDDHHHRSSSNKNGGIGRRVSVRRSDQQPLPYGAQSPNNNQLQAQQQWAHHRQGSSSNLPTSAEEDESNLDPFLQRDDDSTPQVPPKDLRYQHHPQQYVPSNQQEQYRPPLARVNTEGSYHTQGGVDHYSPDQHPGLQQQSPQQQQQYQTYSGQPEQQQQNQNHYQAFNPQAPSPHPANAQQPAEIALQQQNYYQYQAQQQQRQSQQQEHSPQESIQYQQHFQPNQPHQGNQEYQHGQPGRPHSQHQQNVPELQHPQGIHQTAPILNQNSQQVDPQHQQLRPPSSQQQLTPPSPILQPPQYHAYDPQQPGQAVESQEQEILQQSQNNMAPSGSQRNTLRKVNEAGQPAPSRESSLLQPQGQGQGREPPPVSPGVPSFGTNVVPPASQGQPYRGEKGQQGQGQNQGQGQGQGGPDMGRSTPPPRGPDMTEEEILQLVKEHEVLREKYQKVKRYFFEQQSQVHSLQNTLAHQRLSLSRTSWDDSEYATRFNRLDGLIAQLSFAIRKDWKSIPPWLHVAVNKTAVETGKQEMTAVGRAFISQWLVENIFEKYFHPDLEAGFSTQLKQIQTNIRRYSPTCQTSEDEEALVSKTINWRLATLEGLTEMMKSPQCPANREKLIETLNEKLIASLQMFMKEPAPPDLNAGVPMIVELAVTVTQHLPLESRDVHIEYFPPGHGLVSDFMKMESGIPALTDPIQEPDDADRASIRSVASDIRDSISVNEQERPSQQQPPPSAAPAKEVADKKRSLFGIGGSKKQPAQLGKRESSLGAGGSQQSLQQPPGSSHGPKDEPAPPRVRLAVGVAVQIRGKSILVKAPVYST